MRYVPARSGALVGGDVYDVMCTPFGVRLLVGDVMGKGLSAVETAMDVLGSFRELAGHEPWLPVLARRMDAALARREGAEDFVTALLVTFAEDGGGAELVCCGHPPPLLVRRGRATFVDALPPVPPLGLLDLQDGWCAASDVPLAPGDRLLFYTDGVTEARDADGSSIRSRNGWRACTTAIPHAFSTRSSTISRAIPKAVSRTMSRCC
ncbi:PP2C family protein-serine/threonine phosphatase [Streptomyces sp. M19]